jgi:hypothetical protein
MEQTTESDEKKRSYHSRVRQRQAEETRRRIRPQRVNCSRAVATRQRRWKPLPRRLSSRPKRLPPCLVPNARCWLRRSTLRRSAPTSSNLSRNCAQPRTRHDDSRSWLRSPTRRMNQGAALTGIAADCWCRAPELADVARQIEARRRQNQARLVASLREQGVLRTGLSFEEATDVLWALTSYDLYRMLVVEQRWVPERYETWLAQLLVQHLLASH